MADDNNESTKKLVFGIVLDINGEDVGISTNDISKAKQQGIEFTLPEPVDVGTIENFETWFSAKFGVNIPSPENLPAPLDQVVKDLTNLDLGVDAFHIKIPPSESADKQKKYTLRMHLTWSKEHEIDLEVFKIKGAVFGVTNELETTDSGTDR